MVISAGNPFAFSSCAFFPMDAGGTLPPPLPPELEAFHRLVAPCGKRKGGPSQRFVKKVDIPSVEPPADRTCRSALNLAERGLIGQFIGLWPSPKVIDGWVQRNWRPLVSKGISNYFVGRGFFVFVFESVEDRDLFFEMAAISWALRGST